MDDEKLIELVEAHDVLYNRHHRFYKNQEKKNEAFEAIAAELGIPYVQFVVNRYRTLRDRFVRYKRLRGTEDGAKFYLPVMEKMEFLSPNVFNRKNRSKHNIKSGNSFDSDCSNSMDPLQFPTSKRYRASEQSINISPVLTIEKSFQPSVSSKGHKRKAETLEETTSKKANIDNNTINIDEEFREALTCFQKICKAKEENQKNEALEGFRHMIVSTIAQMSSSKQTKAMLCVTEAVMHLKMEDDDLL
ncbi:uncharacterized protein LOC106090774 [Stomoxys calcitrans]|uniref:uncharacterized protein LOC106090774 n=1 Tax=Stomoxys calcitrans TaxID=35570 RepID=UPI0027E2C3B6|nr:uncharacterized protein LOC106090774 [Stomoxys calcitrans]